MKIRIAEEAASNGEKIAAQTGLNVEIVPERPEETRMPKPLTIEDVRSAYRVADMAVRAVALGLIDRVHYVEPDHDGDVFLGEARIGGLYPVPNRGVYEAVSSGSEHGEFDTVREATLWLIEHHIKRDLV